MVRSYLEDRPREADEWLCACLGELGRLDRAQAVAQAGIDERVRRIERICSDVVEVPGRRWSVRELAASCSLSPDHFTRLFKEVRGITPRELIMRARIDAARLLLLSSSHSITRIAELTGFADIYGFSRQFKARTGRSPSRFRRRGAGSPRAPHTRRAGGPSAEGRKASGPGIAGPGRPAAGAGPGGASGVRSWRAGRG